MEIKFIGYGGAFDYAYTNSSLLLKVSGHSTLVDCGHSVYPALRQKSLVDSFDYFLPTHLHDDHAGSLSTLIFHRYFAPGSEKLKIICPSEDFKNELIAYLSFSMQEPEKFCSFHPIAEFPFLEAIDTFGKHSANMQTYAYQFSDDEKTIAYSGDLGDPDLIFSQLKARRMEGSTVFHDIFFMSRIATHAYYKDLEKHAEDFKIIGYHNDPKTRPADCIIPFVSEFPEYLI